MAKTGASRHAPHEIDTYLEPLPDDVQAALQRVREVIRETAPACTERVSYGIPIFRLTKDLVGISAHKNHCSLHTMSPDLTETMVDELKGLKVSGATIHFTPKRPLPRELVEKIVRERTQELGTP
jgi:uncharacterized protein YdhG (YjbR/CyaY superfamily)